MGSACIARGIGAIRTSARPLLHGPCRAPQSSISADFVPKLGIRACLAGPSVRRFEGLVDQNEWVFHSGGEKRRWDRKWAIRSLRSSQNESLPAVGERIGVRDDHRLSALPGAVVPPTAPPRCKCGGTCRCIRSPTGGRRRRAQSACSRAAKVRPGLPAGQGFASKKSTAGVSPSFTPGRNGSETGWMRWSAARTRRVTRSRSAMLSAVVQLRRAFQAGHGLPPPHEYPPTAMDLARAAQTMRERSTDSPARRTGAKANSALFVSIRW